MKRSKLVFCIQCRDPYDPKRSQADFHGFCGRGCQHKFMKQHFDATFREGRYYQYGMAFTPDKRFYQELAQRRKMANNR